jgi:hypothetical protein
MQCFWPLDLRVYRFRDIVPHGFYTIKDRLLALASLASLCLSEFTQFRHNFSLAFTISAFIFAILVFTFAMSSFIFAKFKLAFARLIYSSS